MQANFRSFRDSGITYLAMAALSVDLMMRRCGHDMVQTTMGYVKQAEDLSGDLGVPFGPLPEALVGFGRVSEFRLETTPQTPSKQCRRRESNPRPSAYETPALTN